MYIIIRFNKTLENCNVMFFGLSNITKIIFNSFDSSQLLNMEYMFGKCTNLISLDLNNLNTSSVI